MKSLYVCEKCGKMFEEYDQAWACERSHITLDQVFSWDLPNGSDKQMENFLEKLHTGRLTRRDIRRYTTSIGVHVNKVYGW